MKMNKKGFTLIELLAIIVILAIIAVITVPIILNIIDNARTGAARNSALGYADTIKLAYVEYQYGSNENVTGSIAQEVTMGSVTTNLYVSKEGSDVECTGVQITNGKLTITSCTVGGNKTFHTYADGAFAD